MDIYGCPGRLMDIYGCPGRLIDIYWCPGRLIDIKFVNEVVGYIINTIKTTFDLNFDLYKAVIQHGYTLT